MTTLATSTHVPFAAPASRGKLFRNGWEIAWMVIAFVVFWPAGLALVAYYKWRPDMSRMTRRAERAARRSFPAAADFVARRAEPASSGNSAFDAYRDEVLARLEAERRKLDAEQRAFGDFLEELRRQKDREAFDRFMASRRAGPQDGDGVTNA
ncbi:DUF2852 domain-containing protein [Salinarimonas sp.]|uniref:DUF2852 domain-containing protein n=1 Tax=Salinarimonas sp. TaxID=2766526 RepID=UPI0032D8ED27